VTAVDWARWRKCPVCFAELGEPCQRMTGLTADGPVSIEALSPHGGRELRAGYAR
jgi:hypothetical protein